MVKKIRVIDAPTEQEEVVTDAAFRKYMMELAKSADWKLWEMMQSMQNLEKKLTVIDNDDK
jgi:hypothetical protein